MALRGRAPCRAPGLLEPACGPALVRRALSASPLPLTPPSPLRVLEEPASSSLIEATCQAGVFRHSTPPPHVSSPHTGACLSPDGLAGLGSPPASAQLSLDSGDTVSNRWCSASLAPSTRTHERTALGFCLCCSLSRNAIPSPGQLLLHQGQGEPLALPEVPCRAEWGTLSSRPMASAPRPDEEILGRARAASAPHMGLPGSLHSAYCT